MEPQDGITLSFKIEISKGLLEVLMGKCSVKDTAKVEDTAKAEDTAKVEDTAKAEDTAKTKEKKSEETLSSNEDKSSVKDTNVSAPIVDLFNIFGKIYTGKRVTEEDTNKMLNHLARATCPSQGSEDQWLGDLAKKVIDHEPPYQG